MCRNCTAKECKELRIRIECPCCDGKGCDECTDGKVNIDGCPCEYIADVRQAIHLADLFEKGMPPIAGGALDQAFSFTQAVRILANEDAKIRNELNRGN